jgi:hypothetical protein
MAQLFANNAKSTLSTSISDIDTIITLQTGGGSKFPSNLSNTNYILVTLSSIDGLSQEVIKVTGISGDIFTSVVRGYELGPPKTFIAGDNVYLSITSSTLDLLPTTNLNGTSLYLSNKSDSIGSYSTLFGIGSSCNGYSFTTVFGKGTSSIGHYNCIIGSSINTLDYSTDSCVTIGSFSSLGAAIGCVALGDFSFINGANSIAIGSGSSADTLSVAIGPSSYSYLSSVAIGKNSYAENSSVTFGVLSSCVGYNNISIGCLNKSSSLFSNTITSGSQLASTVIGSGNVCIASSNKGSNSIIIGSYSVPTEIAANNSVIISHGSSLITSASYTSLSSTYPNNYIENNTYTGNGSITDSILINSTAFSSSFPGSNTIAIGAGSSSSTTTGVIIGSALGDISFPSITHVGSTQGYNLGQRSSTIGSLAGYHGIYTSNEVTIKDVTAIRGYATTASGNTILPNINTGCSVIGRGSFCKLPATKIINGTSQIPVTPSAQSTKIFSKCTGYETIFSKAAISSTIFNVINSNLFAAEAATSYVNYGFICTRVGFVILTGTVSTPPTITIAGNLASKVFTPSNTVTNSISVSPELPVLLSNGTGNITFINTTASTGTFTARLLVYGYFIGI